MDVPKYILDPPVIRAKRSGTQLLLSLLFSPAYLSGLLNPFTYTIPTEIETF